MPLGFSENSTLHYIEAREEAYLKMFGSVGSVSHELVPQVPHVDVYTFPPSRRRPFHTLITGGMSDWPMRVPEGVPERTELILYVAEPAEQHEEVLRWLAHLVHDQDTWISPGSTISNGRPPEPIFANSRLDNFLFLPPPAKFDKRLPRRLQIEGTPVSLLWVVPITTPERDFIIANGPWDFMDIMERNKHPLPLREGRVTYV